MAVVNVKSTAITGADATPPTKGTTMVGPRRLYEQASTVEVTNGDSIASVFRFARVPSNIRVSSLNLFCDAITSAAADFGVYQTAANGGAVVDADAFGSAVSLATAITIGSNIVHESGVYDISEVEQPLWQMLGLTADPKIEYDLAATLTAAATATGTLTMLTRYSQSN